MLINLEKLIKDIQKESWAKELPADKNFWLRLMDLIEQRVLSEFLDQVTQQVDEIVDIDPDLTEPQILERATRCMVDFLGAHSASVRIYDPLTEQMLSYGSYPFEEEKREIFIPLEGSIAGEVVKTRQPYLVPDILDEKRYENKQVIYRKGVHSLMAVPLEIPRFFPRERDTVGVIQIYFGEKERAFTRLEIQMANLMAKRLSFVIARKKILSLHRTNEKKETIVRHIFRTLETRGGIKMEEAFNRVIPELADMVNLQSCALFSISGDLKNVILQAGFPESGGYHSIGKSFLVSREPAFELLLSLRDYSGESAYEVVTPSYILVVDPQRSGLISKNLKRFTALHNINSILYFPLSVDGEVTHLMTFDALDQRQRYSDDEIDIFLFLGRELMKAHKMERLDDALHDFKNPAIATAGFARRLKKLLEKEELGRSEDQIMKYTDILLEETSRLQELALSLYRVGEEQLVNITEMLKRRFEINREAIREQLKQNIMLREGPFDGELNVRCYPIHVERVFDNLLNNATKAIPLKGGMLTIRTYAEGEWVCAEISNTGDISEEDRLKILEGEGEGRGLYITHRIIRLLKGKIEVQQGKGTTSFRVLLPLYKG
jgi:signal transduction histidine kinase